MTRLDPTSSLAVLLRAQAPAPARAPGSTVRAAAHAPATSPTGTEALAQAAAAATERLQASTARGPQRRALAVRLYLESVLLQRLGPGAALDPGWPALLDAVQAGLAADPALARAADDLGRALAAA